MEPKLTDLPERERRTAPRTLLDQYESVQFNVRGLPHLYQFKIRDISAQGLCILVRQDSDILPRLVVGDTLEMAYQKTPPTEPGRPLQTRITHVTRQGTGRYSGHSLVGLAVIDDSTGEKGAKAEGAPSPAA